MLATTAHAQANDWSWKGGWEVDLGDLKSIQYTVRLWGIVDDGQAERGGQLVRSMPHKTDSS